MRCAACQCVHNDKHGYCKIGDIVIIDPRGKCSIYKTTYDSEKEKNNDL